MGTYGPEHTDEPERKTETQWESWQNLAIMWGSFFQNVTSIVAHSLHSPTPPLVETAEGQTTVVLFRVPSPLPLRTTSALDVTATIHRTASALEVGGSIKNKNLVNNKH